MSVANITPANIKKIKDLTEISSKNQPGSSQWTDAEDQIKTILWSMYIRGSPKDVRLKLYNSGLVELIIPLVQAPDGKHADSTLESVYGIFNSCMAATDSVDSDNVETLTRGVKLGLIEIAVKELQRRPLRYGGRLLWFAFGCINNPGSYPEFTKRIVSSGALPSCIELIREGGDLHDEVRRTIISTALGVLSFVARYDLDTARSLPGLVDAAHQYLPLLTRNGEDEMIMLGFGSSRLLIRTFGKDETSKVIQENPVILEFFPKLLRAVLDAGFKTNYLAYNSYWKVSGLCLDLSIMSLSDTNKKLLLPLVPLMIETMAFHINGDKEVIKHGMVFLSQVSFDESCLAAMVTDKERIKTIQGIVLADKSYDKETLSLLSVVMNAVFPSAISITAASNAAPTSAAATTTTTRRTSAFRRAINLVVGSSTSTDSTGNASGTATAGDLAQIQVMISYHQKSTGEHAQMLHQVLKKRNFRVWIDVNDMKGDIQEAMAQAVQSSDVIVVLVSSGYKESANCRLECQYAMKQNKPILFLVCQQTYTSPTGWLGLIMGQRMWVGVFTPAMVESKADEVVRRLDEVLKGENDEITSSTTTTTTSTSPVAAVTSPTHGHTMGEMMTTLMKRVDILETSVGKITTLENQIITLTNENEQLKSRIVVLESEMKTVKGG
jgi:hypothetical protein